jgi:hypothetical protein
MHPTSNDFVEDDLEHKPLYRASGSTKPILGVGELPNGGDGKDIMKALILPGLIFDKVKAVGSVCSTIPARLPKEWEEMLHLDQVETAAERDKIIKNFLSTMMAGRNPVGGSLESNELTLSHCFATLTIPDDPKVKKFKDEWSRGAALWLQRSSNILRSRRSTITEKGYFGLVHRYVDVGDDICLLFGCSVPVILRKRNCEQHLFLGDCYIEGRMNGEIIESVGEEEIAKKVTGETFKKWLDDPSMMPEGANEPRALFLV